MIYPAPRVHLRLALLLWFDHTCVYAGVDRQGTESNSGGTTCYTPEYDFEQLVLSSNCSTFKRRRGKNATSC